MKDTKKKEQRSGKERRSEKGRGEYNGPNYKSTSFYLFLSNIFL